MLWIGIGVLVLMLGGGGAGWYFMTGHAASGEPKEEEVHEEPAEVIEFQPFVVNLADPGVSRFLRVSLSLVVRSHEAALALEDRVTQTRVRSSLLDLLSTQTSAALVTPEGKATLKQAILAAASKAAEAKVTDVYFSEFIVQF
jgi:flagellar FliL protein